MFCYHLLHRCNTTDPLVLDSELVNDLDKMFWQIFDLGFGRITTLDAADVHCVPGAHEQSELLGGNENTIIYYEAEVHF